MGQVKKQNTVYALALLMFLLVGCGKGVQNTSNTDSLSGGNSQNQNNNNNNNNNGGGNYYGVPALECFTPTESITAEIPTHWLWGTVLGPSDVMRITFITNRPAALIGGQGGDLVGMEVIKSTSYTNGVVVDVRFSKLDKERITFILKDQNYPIETRCDVFVTGERRT